MRATVELPESIARMLQIRAVQQASTIEAVLLEAIEKGIGQDDVLPRNLHRVRLPLIRSLHPGALRSLTNSEVDDLVGP